MAYNAAKRRYQRGKDPAEKPSPLAHLASAAEAGVLVRRAQGLWGGGGGRRGEQGTDMQ